MLVYVYEISPEGLLEHGNALRRMEAPKPRKLLSELELQHDDLTGTGESDIEAKGRFVKKAWQKRRRVDACGSQSVLHLSRYAIAVGELRQAFVQVDHADAFGAGGW